MATFVCRYGTPGGTIRTERRKAPDGQAARRELEAQGALVFGVARAAVLRVPRLARLASLPGRVPSRDLLLFAQEFHALVRAGLPVLQALDTLVGQCASARLRLALERLREDVSAGIPVSDAAARRPRAFPDLLVASLRAGERSGSFVESLARYIVLLKRHLALRKRVVIALAYPAILFALSTAVVGFLLWYVVPVFSRAYADMAVALPGPTLLLLQATEVLSAMALPLAIGAVAAGVAAHGWWHSPSGRRQVDALLVRIPMLGEVIRRYAAAVFCRTLAMLLGGGLPILGALETAIGSVGNRALRATLVAVVPGVAGGGGLGAALARSGVLPPTAVEMVAVGESAGALPDMLVHVAEFFDEDLDLRLQSLTAVLEPAIMVVMGLFVGTLVVVMYLPIFELSGQIR